MNIDKVNDENIFNIKLKKNRRQIYNSVSNKINIFTGMPNSNIRKNYIMQILNKKSNQQKQNLINKINLKLSKVMINSGIHDNIYNKNNEEFSSEKEIRYKIKLEEKNNIIKNLINEIDYYKKCIKIRSEGKNKINLNNNLNIKNVFNFSPKNRSGINDIDMSVRKSLEFRQYNTIDNEYGENVPKVKYYSPNNNINVLVNDNSVKNIFEKYSFYFPELKKNKLVQKKYNNLTQENNVIKNINISKINNLKITKRNDTFNSFDFNNNKNQNKLRLCSMDSTSFHETTDNNNDNNQKSKMIELQKRMNGLLDNLFSIIEDKRKKLD